MQSLTKAIPYAFLGGILLNFMPCVFPILSLKILSLLNNKKKRYLSSIYYSLGILVSFLALAFVAIALKTSGNLVGWGFHLQSPTFITILILVLFAIGMNLSGFYEIKQINFRENHHFLGEFSTGLLTALLASPCAAPFMAVAIGYALTQSEMAIILVFEALGAGVAFPYLFLTLFPGLTKFLPNPGEWTENLKQLLAFPIYGAVAWLLVVLSQQVGTRGLAIALFGLVYLGFLVWCWRFCANHTLGIRSLFIVISTFALLKLVLMMQQENGEYVEKIKFSFEKLNRIIENKQIAFVSVTASWCITCKVNEKLILNTKEFSNILEEYQISFLEADWTTKDESITKYLNSFGRSGVPLYVIYASDGSYTVLSPFITKKYILDSILSLN
jgi:thiol:disulfide interchange protein DsbD